MQVAGLALSMARGHYSSPNANDGALYTITDARTISTPILHSPAHLKSNIQ